MQSKITLKEKKMYDWYISLTCGAVFDMDPLRTLLPSWNDFADAKYNAKETWQ